MRKAKTITLFNDANDFVIADVGTKSYAAYIDAGYSECAVVAKEVVDGKHAASADQSDVIPTEKKARKQREKKAVDEDKSPEYEDAVAEEPANGEAE